MNTTNTSVDFNSFINTLDQINKDKYSFHVFVPSLQQDIPFLQITTSQQKTLIKSIIDSQVYNTEFIFALYNIIKSNCLDKSVDIDQLTLLDKLAIMLSLRCKSISNKYSLEIDKDGVTGNYEVDLDQLVDRCKDISQYSKKTLTYQDYTLVLQPPTIGMEYRIERDIRSKAKGGKSQDINTPDELREAVGEAFITELIKFIESVEVSSEQTSMKIEFAQISCKDAIKVLEKLPIKTIEQVLKYAEDFNKTSTDVLKIQVPTIDPETKETVFKEEEISVNGNFFIFS